jgi:hypothetical protein
MSYIKAKRSVTVELRDGTHKVVQAGDVVNTDDVADHFRESVEKGSGYTADLFESGKEQKAKEVDPMTVDSRLLAENDAEKLSRARAEYSDAERFGTATVETPPAHLQAGRTLPENGADVAAANKYAQGTHDTSESGFDLISAGMKMGDPPPVASDAPSETAEVTDQKPAAKPAAKKAE